MASEGKGMQQKWDCNWDPDEGLMETLGEHNYHSCNYVATCFENFGVIIIIIINVLNDRENSLNEKQYQQKRNKKLSELQMNE